MSKVVGCRTLMPVGVMLDMGDGKVFTVPVLYDRIADEVIVINRRDHDLREDVANAVRDYFDVKRNSLLGSQLVADPVDAKTWEDIKTLTGLAKPPAQEM